MAEGKHFYIESFETVQLSSYRLGQSPFVHRYVTDQTIFGLYCDRLYPLKSADDEDPIPKYWKLRNGVLLYDVPEQPLEIVGPDAVRVLEKVLVCQAETLGVGRGRYGIACNEDGTVVMDGVVMRLGPDRFWYVKANGEFISWLKAGAIGLDAEVSDPQSQVLQIQGPKSLDVLNAAIGGGLSADFKYFRAGFFDIGGQTLWVSRTGWTGEVGIEVYCNSGPEPTDHDALWDHLFACGACAVWQGVQLVVVDGDPANRGRNLGQRQRYRARSDAVRRRPRAVRQLRQGRLHRPGCVGDGRSQPASVRSGLSYRNAGTRDERALRKRPCGAHDHRHMVAHTGSRESATCASTSHCLEMSGWAKRSTLHDRDGRPHKATVALLPFVDKEKRLPRAAWNG